MQTGPIERVLRRDGVVVGGALALLVALAALYTVRGTGMEMTALEMTRMARPIGTPMDMPMGPVWSIDYVILVALMWWIMMIAMMTPSAAPFLLLFAAMKRIGKDCDRVRLDVGLALAGYLGVWAAFSIAATALQWLAQSADVLNGAMMTLNSRQFAGIVLTGAGLYQLTPLKRACLAHCRAPGDFLARHSRPGPAGALRLGIRHGAFCLGCCWAVMLLLFVGGIMNLWWIVGLTAYVLAEKLLPFGQALTVLAGVALMGGGLILILT